MAMYQFNLCNYCQNHAECSKRGILAMWTECDEFKPIKPQTTNSTNFDISKVLKAINAEETK